VCPSDSYGGYGALFDTRCFAVNAAWSGAVLDTKRERLLLWGGGHTDYNGNEIFAYDLPSGKMLRLTPPSRPANDVEALSDPAGPNARHTYDCLAYIKHTDEMFVCGGFLAGGVGVVSHGEWVLPLSSVPNSCAATSQTAAGCTPLWNEVDLTLHGPKLSTPSNANTGVGIADYYEGVMGHNGAFTGNKHVYMIFNSQGTVFDYNRDTNTQTLCATGEFAGQSGSGAIEQNSGIFVTVAGGGFMTGIQLPRCTQVDHTNDSPSTCNALTKNSFVGMSYDYDAGMIFAMPGTGSTGYYIYTGGVNTAGKWHCIPVNLGSATPPNYAVNSTGNTVHGRFRYVPVEHAFVSFPGNSSPGPETGNVWYFRPRAK